MSRLSIARLPLACLVLLLAATVLLPRAQAANCITESQMTPAQRDAISTSARTLLGQVQHGDIAALKANTIPQVASDFDGIAASATTLQPLLQHATITVNSLYGLDASMEPAGAAHTDFYCGMPLVVLNFTSLPPAKYALAILDATGVATPQQITFILSQPAASSNWMLAGFFPAPMLEDGHTGLWYWTRARDFAQKKMNWAAWFNYQIAASLIQPVEFISSPNLEKLRQEAAQIRPENLPGASPMTLSVQGEDFQITSLDTTTELGGLDLDVHYAPTAAQLLQLQHPTTARQQVLRVMTALLAAHPDLRAAFRGVWMRADQDSASVFALDLQMNQIPIGSSSPNPAPAPAPTPTTATALPPAVPFNPTQPQSQPDLSLDHDPILSPDPQVVIEPNAASAPTTGPAGEIQKNKNGLYTLHEDVNEVVLYTTVVNENKILVPDLTRSDFRVWEDNVPQTIDSFRFQDLPVSMGILVDNSGSMRDKRFAVNAAALDLVRASNQKDEAFIVNFSDKAYLDQDFTSNILSLEQGLSHLDTKSTTALYDAVVASADQLSRHGKQTKQVLILITDGVDNASRLTLNQAIRRVQTLAGPTIYSIGLLFGDDKAQAAQVKSTLEALSAQTGGVAYFPTSIGQVDATAEELARNIRNQYIIGYHSTKPAKLGGYRVLRIAADSSRYGNLTATTRPGYYPRQAIPAPAISAPATSVPASQPAPAQPAPAQP